MKNKIFSGECKFIAGVTKISEIPANHLNEFAFIGRSNVGKSSLINAVTGRTQLARTSNTPGRTQQINFFDIAGYFTLVDMPGYGFAKASKKKVTNWNMVNFNYLRARKNLKRVFLLIDSRHGLKENDREIMRILDDSAISYQMIFTKIDKVTKQHLSDIEALVIAEANEYTALHPEIIKTSSNSKLGIDDICDIILDISNKEKAIAKT